ncbi:MAG TPA: glycosyltransferase [Solirubrobacteraceae bacterium]|nr:glycosyltransferase [Solirubrobacteraceae bacterium]
MRFGCVVLTAGGRPDELRLGVESLLRQEGVEVDVVVVGNGCDPSEGLPEGARVVALPEDRGIPAGRNAGVPHTSGELLFFLDDDARLEGTDALARVARAFEDPSVGLVQLRVAPSDGGAPRRDWVPKVGRGGTPRTSDITVVWEGAVGARRELFERVGGWPEEFRYVHEGVDLAWKVMDAGLRVLWLADAVVLHPTTKTAPRHYSFYFGARNRVWLARRYLPWPLAVLYVAVFAARNVPRMRSRRFLREAARGYRDGLRQPCGPRRVLRGSTLVRMTRAGRPPIM